MQYGHLVDKNLKIGQAISKMIFEAFLLPKFEQPNQSSIKILFNPH